MTKSREPVSIEDVKAAYDELQEEGIRPSARNIRERLGRGSFSTLQEMLTKVTEGRITEEDELKAFSTRLHDLCMEMTFHIEELAKSKTAVAREEVEKARANVEKLAKDTQVKLDNANIELKHERASNNDLRKRLASTTDHAAELQEKLATKEAAAAELKIELSAALAKLERVESALADAKIQREHYETMVAQQRQADEEKFANAISSYQHTIEKMRAAEIVRAEEVATCRVMIDQKEKDLRDTNQRLNEEKLQAAEERQASTSLRADIAKLTEELSILKEQARNQKSQLDELKSLSESKDEQIAKLTDEAQGLRTNLLAFQQEASTSSTQYQAEKERAVRTVLEHAVAACKLASRVVGPDNRELTTLLANQEQLEKLFT